MKRKLTIFACIAILSLSPLWVSWSYRHLFTTRIRETTPHLDCKKNLRDLSFALFACTNDHKGFIPPTESGDPPRSWRVDLLPYLGLRAIHQRYRKDLAWNDGTNAGFGKLRLPVFQCPQMKEKQTATGDWYSAYSALPTDNGVWNTRKSMRLDTITSGDGTANTIMLVEACDSKIVWSEPRDVSLESMKKNQKILSSNHDGQSVNVLFADGSVRRLSKDVSYEVLSDLCSVNGGEKQSEF